MAERAERCETCKWWERISSAALTLSPGYCHRQPPKFVIELSEQPIFPSTMQDNFCGEWTRNSKDEEIQRSAIGSSTTEDQHGKHSEPCRSWTKDRTWKELED